MSQRTERIDELLRQEISGLLAKEVADPGVGFATVTEVETSADLSHARVWFSVIGQPEERRRTLEALRRAMPYIRRELGRRLRLRRIPELHALLDDSSERGTRVMQLLSELEAGGLPAELPEGEVLPTPAPRAGHADGSEPAGSAAEPAAGGAGGTGGRSRSRRPGRSPGSRTRRPGAR